MTVMKISFTDQRARSTPGIPPKAAPPRKPATRTAGIMRGGAGAGQGEGHARPRDSPPVDLAVYADVEEAAAQADHHREAAQQERADLVEGLADPAQAAQGADQD